MAYGIEPKEFSFPITKHSSNYDQHQHREGWVWKVAGKIELAMSTAPPKAAWQPDNHRNLQAQISEYHDKDFFKQMATVHIDIQKVKKVLGEVKGDRKKRKEAGKTIALAKETAKSLLMARVIVMGQAAPEKLLELAVNAVTMYEGEESGARQIKIDFTTAEKTAEKLRKVSGGEGIMFITCGYDEERWEDRKMKDGFRWPTKLTAVNQQNSRSWKRRESLQKKQWNPVDTRWGHVQDQSSVRRRRRMEAKMLSKPPPPSVNFVADGLPGSIPNQVIEQVMKETLDWDVKVARVIERQKEPS